jgi:hypothetical protein
MTQYVRRCYVLKERDRNRKGRKEGRKEGKKGIKELRRVQDKES